ncbi:prefoldin subunit beta [Candidatus Woesearchaeota archaeon]|nr:prefoldin subunit beta [Candidatus Woesearchaeota archaeon]
MSEAQEMIQQLQALEQSMQSYTLQKQNVQAQILEAESALAELEKSDEAFRIVGNIMVKAKKDVLVKELQEKAESLRTRLSTIEKQEERLKKEVKQLQKELGDA